MAARDDDAGMWLPDDDTALTQAKMLIQEIKDDGELDCRGWTDALHRGGKHRGIGRVECCGLLEERPQGPVCRGVPFPKTEQY